MPQVDTPALRLMGRGQTYTLLVGVVGGLLVAGLLIPFVFGTPLSQAGGTPQITDDGLGGLAGDAEGPQAAADATDDGAGASTGAEDDASGGGASGDGLRSPEVAEPADGGSSNGQDGTAGGGGGGGDGNGSGSSGGGGDGGRLTASDRGVSEETIRLGVLVMDTGGAGNIGIGVAGINPQAQQEAWQAFIDEVNDRGGVGGRMIEPVYRVYDVLSQESMRSACLYLTQDERVFAVVDSGGFFGAAVLCVTDENETPLLVTGSTGIPTELFDRSHGRLFTLFMDGRRAMYNLANEAHKLGALDGRTIGILTDERPGQPETTEHLERALGRLGYEVAYTASLDADLSTGASRVPIEVQQMRSAGVDAVILIGSIVYANQFAQTADSQRWYPQYFVTDWQNGSTDVYGQPMPDSYDGAIAISAVRTNEEKVDLPEPSDSAACMQVHRERTGTRVERGSNEYGSYIRSCTIIELFEAAAGDAGSQLTRAGFLDALAGQGKMSLGELGPGSFTPEKHNAADHVRTLRWRSDCRCYLPQDRFRRVEH
jgi:ABC-type branched-subunit amino acid transport system substrate-binding protein